MKYLGSITYLITVNTIIEATSEEDAKNKLILSKDSLTTKENINGVFLDNKQISSISIVENNGRPYTKKTWTAQGGIDTLLPDEFKNKG